MKLHTLKPAAGAIHKSKRVGRGEGSGLGTTAGKGNKGQQSRTGYSAKKGHEGGQMPIQRRLPKRGFKSPFKTTYKVFNLSQVEKLVEKYDMDEFSVENLYANWLIQSSDFVKVLGGGSITKKITFKVDAISNSAKAAIEKAGGSVELL